MGSRVSRGADRHGSLLFFLVWRLSSSQARLSLKSRGGSSPNAQEGHPRRQIQSSMWSTDGAAGAPNATRDRISARTGRIGALTIPRTAPGRRPRPRSAGSPDSAPRPGGTRRGRSASARSRASAYPESSWILRLASSICFLRANF